MVAFAAGGSHSEEFNSRWVYGKQAVPSIWLKTEENPDNILCVKHVEGALLSDNDVGLYAIVRKLTDFISNIR